DPAPAADAAENQGVFVGSQGKRLYHWLPALHHVLPHHDDELRVRHDAVHGPARRPHGAGRPVQLRHRHRHHGQDDPVRDMTLAELLPKGMTPEDAITLMAGVSAFVTVLAVWYGLLAPHTGH